MEMRMSFGHRHVQRQEQQLEQRLTMEQRHTLELRLSQLRLDLINMVRDERYEPQAGCPKCQKQLTVPEILRGFNRDPNDLTTECPKCRTRFESRLACTPRMGVSVEMVFYCPSQTLARLDGLADLTPEILLMKHPAVGRSAITHFGTLKNAFARNDIAYAFDEKLEWEEKVVPFLGKLPDTDIAAAVNVTKHEIRRMRLKRDIPAFSKRDALETADV